MDTLPDRSVTHVCKLICHLCLEVQQLVIDQYHYDSNNGEVIRYYGLYSEIEIDEKDFVPIKEPIWVES